MSPMSRTAGKIQLVEHFFAVLRLEIEARRASENDVTKAEVAKRGWLKIWTRLLPALIIGLMH